MRKHGHHERIRLERPIGRMPRCRLTGKIKFDTPDAATTMAARLMHELGLPMNVFFCRGLAGRSGSHDHGCRKWHVGTRDKFRLLVNEFGMVFTQPGESRPHDE